MRAVHVATLLILVLFSSLYLVTVQGDAYIYKVERGVYAIYVSYGKTDPPGILFYAKYYKLLMKSRLAVFCGVNKYHSLYDILSIYDYCEQELYDRDIWAVYLVSWYIKDENATHYFITLRVDIVFAKVLWGIFNLTIKDLFDHIAVEEEVIVSKADRSLYYQGRRVGIWPFFLLPYEVHEGYRVKLIELHPLKHLLVGELKRSKLGKILRGTLESYGLKFDTSLSISKYFDISPGEGSESIPELIKLNNVSVGEFLRMERQLVYREAVKYGEEVIEYIMRTKRGSSGILTGIGAYFDVRSGIAISLNTPEVCIDPFISVVPLMRLDGCSCYGILLVSYGKGYDNYIKSLVKVMRLIGMNVSVEDVVKVTKASTSFTSSVSPSQRLTRSTSIPVTTLRTTTRAVVTKHGVTSRSTHIHGPTKSTTIAVTTSVEEWRYTGATSGASTKSRSRSMVFTEVSTSVIEMPTSIAMKSAFSISSASGISTLSSARYMPKDIAVLAIGIAIAVAMAVIYIVRRSRS